MSKTSRPSYPRRSQRQSNGIPTENNHEEPQFSITLPNADSPDLVISVRLVHRCLSALFN